MFIVKTKQDTNSPFVLRKNCGRYIYFNFEKDKVSYYLFFSYIRNSETFRWVRREEDFSFYCCLWRDFLLTIYVWESLLFGNKDSFYSWFISSEIWFKIKTLICHCDKLFCRIYSSVKATATVYTRILYPQIQWIHTHTHTQREIIKKYKKIERIWNHDQIYWRTSQHIKKMRERILFVLMMGVRNEISFKIISSILY